MGAGDSRGWGDWMELPTRWTWVWVSSRSWWCSGKPVSCSPWSHKESDMTEQLDWLALLLQLEHCPVCIFFELLMYLESSYPQATQVPFHAPDNYPRSSHAPQKSDPISICPSYLKNCCPNSHPHLKSVWTLWYMDLNFSFLNPSHIYSGRYQNLQLLCEGNVSSNLSHRKNDHCF